jgi:hypothetical protein
MYRDWGEGSTTEIRGLLQAAASAKCKCAAIFLKRMSGHRKKRGNKLKLVSLDLETLMHFVYRPVDIFVDRFFQVTQFERLFYKCIHAGFPCLNFQPVV